MRITEMTHALESSRVLLLALAMACNSSPSRFLNVDEDDKTATGRPSNSRFAVEGRQYMTSRRVDSLLAVGALTQEQADVALRADGIIANQPSDGAIGVDEMELVGSPGYWETFFPEEQATFDRIWSLLELSPRENVVDLNFPRHNITTSWAENVLPDTAEIGSLSPVFQRSCRRLQLTHDSDGNRETVTIADLRTAVFDPVVRTRFTPSEMIDLRLVLGALGNQRSAVSPGVQTRFEPQLDDVDTSFAVGPFAIERSTYYAWAGERDVDARLMRDETLRIRATSGDFTISHSRSESREEVTSNGELVSFGEYIELFDDGERIATLWTSSLRKDRQEVGRLPLGFPLEGVDIPTIAGELVEYTRNSESNLGNPPASPGYFHGSGRYDVEVPTWWSPTSFFRLTLVRGVGRTERDCWMAWFDNDRAEWANQPVQRNGIASFARGNTPWGGVAFLPDTERLRNRREFIRWHEQQTPSPLAQPDLIGFLARYSSEGQLELSNFIPVYGHDRVR